MIQPHHLHTHGPEPLYTPVKADDVRPKIDVRKFDINDETTWPDPERDEALPIIPTLPDGWMQESHEWDACR